jgi:hypothetical protein
MAGVTGWYIGVNVFSECKFSTSFARIDRLRYAAKTRSFCLVVNFCFVSAYVDYQLLHQLLAWHEIVWLFPASLVSTDNDVSPRYDREYVGMYVSIPLPKHLFYTQRSCLHRIVTNRVFTLELKVSLAGNEPKQYQYVARTSRNNELNS